MLRRLDLYSRYRMTDTSIKTNHIFERHWNVLLGLQIESFQGSWSLRRTPTPSCQLTHQICTKSTGTTDFPQYKNNDCVTLVNMPARGLIVSAIYGPSANISKDFWYNIVNVGNVQLLFLVLGIFLSYFWLSYSMLKFDQNVQFCQLLIKLTIHRSFIFYSAINII